MKLRRSKAAFFDSGASSDIAFLLIIYFIVIAGFNSNKGFLLELPEKDAVRFVQKDELLRFELDSSGMLLYQGKPRDIRFAEQQIRSAVNVHPNLALLLTVAPEAPWQGVVSFVELAQRLRIDSFSFTLKTPEPMR